jgi:hypothetical protein
MKSYEKKKVKYKTIVKKKGKIKGDKKLNKRKKKQ